MRKSKKYFTLGDGVVECGHLVVKVQARACAGKRTPGAGFSFCLCNNLQSLQLRANPNLAHSSPL
jgi:hypothetical protein